MPETFTDEFDTGVAVGERGSKYGAPATWTETLNAPPSFPMLPAGGWNWLIGTIVTDCPPGLSTMSAVVVGPWRWMTSPVSCTRNDAASFDESIVKAATPRVVSVTPGR